MTLPAAGILLFCLQTTSFAQTPTTPAIDSATAAPQTAAPETAAPETALVSSDSTAADPAAATIQLAAVNSPTPVPDAPLPQQSTTQDSTTQQQPNIIDKGFYFFLSSKPSKYSTTVKPGQKFVPFTIKEKWIYTARESVSTEAILVIVTSAAFNQWIDGNPHAGSDLGGYGDRLGYIALRNTSGKVFSDAIYASILHTDERYFRMGPGNSIAQRTRHAIVNTFVAHRDRDGSPIFDYAGVAGRASASFLTMAYYPSSSSSAAVAAETFGYSLIGEVAGNAFLEFWPDVVHKITKGKKY